MLIEHRNLPESQFRNGSAKYGQLCEGGNGNIPKHVANAKGAHYTVLTPTNALLHILAEIPKIEP